MAADWTYNGSDTVSVDTTLETTAETTLIQIEASEPNNSYDSSTGGVVTDPVTLTVTTIGGLSPGDEFVVDLRGPDESREARLFTYGTADTGVAYSPGYDYDGSTTLTFDVRNDWSSSQMGGTVTVFVDSDTGTPGSVAGGAQGTTVSGSITDISSPPAAVFYARFSNGFSYVWIARLVIGTPSSGIQQPGDTPPSVPDPVNLYTGNVADRGGNEPIIQSPQA